MIFMCLMNYADRETIARVRPEHRVYMNGLVDAGKAISAGSFLPDDDGGMFLYKADSLEEARELVANDPYIRSGAAPSHRLVQYQVHGANPDLLRVGG